MRILILVTFLSFIMSSCQDKSTTDTQVIASPSGDTKPNEDMIAHIYTSKGLIKVGLEFVKTPMTVANFVALAEGQMDNGIKSKGTPFYDKMVFHRVIKDFMIQGGDPKGNGTGNAGYQFADEFHPDLKHDRPGILSMANSGPNSNSCQFFITHTATPWLDNVHSIFGKVIEGQNIVDAIAENDRIDSIRIIRNTPDAQSFDAVKIYQAQKNIAVESQKTALTSQYASEQVNPMYKAFEEYVKKVYPQALKTSSGLYYLKTSTTDGEQPMPGSIVKVHYKGMLTNGTVFDESISKGKPLEFPIGKQNVIAGWDEGIALLKKGEKATLIIPSYLAYGSQGIQNVIPPNSPLIFEVQLLSFN